MKNQMGRSQQTGFTLLELLIAVIIASIAALGLAYTQTKSLQYARSSSQYTRANIEANNTIEQMWASLCDLQKGTTLLSSLTQNNNFIYTFAPTTFANDMDITVASKDNRLTDVVDSVTINVIFPDISTNATLCP